jgi:hypothetical protein
MRHGRPCFDARYLASRAERRRRDLGTDPAGSDHDNAVAWAHFGAQR